MCVNLKAKILCIFAEDALKIPWHKKFQNEGHAKTKMDALDIVDFVNLSHKNAYLRKTNYIWVILLCIIRSMHIPDITWKNAIFLFI